jgi:hypothetical protein
MTIDMTNNRVPYGLLTDAEKAALVKHKGGVEQYTSCGWRDHVMHKVSYHPCVTYRTVPLPKTQDIIAWEKLPEWVEWVARDGDDGHVHGHQYEPCRGNTAIWFGYCGRRLRIDDFPGLVQIGTADWRESKQRRPRG